MNPDMEKKYNLFHQIVMVFFFNQTCYSSLHSVDAVTLRHGSVTLSPLRVTPFLARPQFLSSTTISFFVQRTRMRSTVCPRTWRACADQRTRLFSSNIHVRIVSREIRQMLRNFIDTVLLCSTIIQRLFLLSLKQMKFVTNMTNGVTKRRNYPVEQGQDIHTRRTKQKLKFMEDCFLYKFENKISIT